MHITNYINEKNKSIWNELKGLYQIDLIYNPKEYSWKVNKEAEKFIITTPTNKIEIESFTHELLHIYIEHKGMSSPEDILHSMYGKESFKILTTNGLFAKIHNFCSHKKMFPYYIELGFSEKKFLSHKANMNFFDFSILKSSFLKKEKIKLSIVDFIGFSISFFNNEGKSQAKKNARCLGKLKKIRPDLFEIIERFNLNWEDSTDFNLSREFMKFDYELNEWLIKNKIPC